MTVVPEFMVVQMLNFGLKSQKVASGEITLQELIRLFRNDFSIAIASKGLIEKCKELKDRDILLFEEKKSYSWLKEITKLLVKILPETKHQELPQCAHNAADNSEKPLMVAEALREFFK